MRRNDIKPRNFQYWHLIERKLSPWKDLQLLEKIGQEKDVRRLGAARWHHGHDGEPEVNSGR